MNRKGQIHIKILVIGVIVICGVVLLSLSLSGKGDFRPVGYVEMARSISEEVLFYESINLDKEEITNRINKDHGLDSFVRPLKPVLKYDGKYTLDLKTSRISITYFFRS
tara:strand:+ start:1074 stop:1400 length:327 start_codon:yes stop_codon:yes gene_type:complete